MIPLKIENYESTEISNPVDTERKLNLHKTFRRRPGRLLNVLCTFNLRPVSNGKTKIRNWEPKDCYYYLCKT